MANFDPVQWLRRQSAPVAVSLAILIVIGAVLTLGSPDTMASLFGFSGSLFPKFWSVVTYQFVNSLGPLGLVFLPLWIIYVGGDVERDHSSSRFLLIWIILTVISWVPFFVLGKQLTSVVIPETALTVMWATRRPNATIMVFGIIPVAAKIIAMLAVAAALVSYGTGNLLMGFLTLIPSLLAFLYALNKLPIRYGYNAYQAAGAKFDKKKREREDAYLNDVFLREQERNERERLRKLFESSLDEGDQKK